MHGGFESLICRFALTEIPGGVQNKLDQYEDRIQCKGGISEIEMPDGRDAVSYGDDRGDTQPGFRVQNDSEGKDEKSQDVKNNS